MKLNCQLGHQQKIRSQEARIDLSFKREVFYCCWRFHRSFSNGNSYDLFFSRKGFWIRPYLDSIWTYSWCQSSPVLHCYRWDNDSYNNWNFNWNNIRNISLQDKYFEYK